MTFGFFCAFLFLLNSGLLIRWMTNARGLTAKLKVCHGGPEQRTLSLYAIFETRRYSLAILIAYPKLTQAAYFVFVWKPWFAIHLVLSVLVITPRFNVMSYFAKGQYAQLHNFLCTRLCLYMKAIVSSSFLSCISHGYRVTTYFIIVPGSILLGTMTLSSFAFEMNSASSLCLIILIL